MANNFHKRHYERVAEAIQEARRSTAATIDSSIGPNDLVHTAAEIAITRVVRELADVFAGDNSQFRRERFITACVPGNNVRARS